MSLPDPFVADGEHLAIELAGGRALFTTRRGGESDGPFRSLNLGLTVPGAAGTGPAPGDDPEAVAANRRALAALVGVPAARFAHGHQVHGSEVARVTDAPDGSWSAARLGGVARADGQVTALRDVAAVVLVADCLPIALIAPGAVAMLHAGWRGLAGGVIAAGVAAVRALGGGADRRRDRPGRGRLLLRGGRRGARGVRPVRAARATTAGVSISSGSPSATCATPASPQVHDVGPVHDLRRSGAVLLPSARRRRHRSPGGRGVAQLIHGLRAERVRANLHEVRDEIGAACRRAGRDPAAVEILAATKYVPLEEMATLAEAGIELVGENRAQDLEAKVAAYGRALHLGLHRPAAEPQGARDRPARPPHPLGGQRERAARARASRRARAARAAHPRRGERRRRAGQGRRRARRARALHRELARSRSPG